jgi:aldehyde dehydrogenase (NAD+)
VTGESLWTEERLLVDGSMRSARSGALFDVVNPATEEVIGQAADADGSDLDCAVGAARRAFDDDWWRNDLDLRVRCLRQFQAALERHADDFRQTIVAEGGSPVAMTYAVQLDTPVQGIEWVVQLAERYEFRRDLGIASTSGRPSHRYLERLPYGVVAAITPWNFPIHLALAKVVPALAAGNTVVLKPAPETPWSGLLLGKLAAEETDMPSGVLNVITSRGNEISQQLVEDPRVDLVSFTGSTATGRHVMSTAAQTVKRVFLELGGKSAFVALDDADLSVVATTVAFQITAHAGQGCALTTRLLLPSSRFDEGVEAVVSAIAGIPYGDPTDPSVIMGPLISERQRQRVLGYIDHAVNSGSTAAIGGGVPSRFDRGYYVEPTVLVGVDPGSRVAQEEIFGPVLTVLSYEGEDDAVAIANNTIYGLSGAVMSASIERARAVGSQMRCGTLSLNGGMYHGYDMPFGGTRQSGVGREMGVEGFDEYLETKVVGEGIPREADGR